MSEAYYTIGTVSDIEPGQRKIITIQGKEVGIFNIQGEFYAILNLCPHMGAPLCRGTLAKKVDAMKPHSFKVDNQFVLQCPWHRWEFDLATGKSVFDESIQIKRYPVRVKNGLIQCKIR